MQLWTVLLKCNLSTSVQHKSIRLATQFILIELFHQMPREICHLLLIKNPSIAYKTAALHSWNQIWKQAYTELN